MHPFFYPSMAFEFVPKLSFILMRLKAKDVIIMQGLVDYCTYLSTEQHQVRREQQNYLT
uniref:Uncharacterized protein n=1 Tax=Rhizophora mucronata TaxID=61149 RepID=A0A2P2Q0B3_RHIMU